MAACDLPSIYSSSSSSLATDPYTTRLGASARRVRPAEAYSDYGFIAVLALTQRLEIDLLPVTWQATLGSLGQGGQGNISQALVNIQTSFAFKHFKHVDQSDPFQEIVQEMVVLRHPAVRDHPHIIQLIGVCWDIPHKDQVWPVLVFEKTHHGDLYRFARSGMGRDLSIEDRLRICVEVGIALRDMHHNNIIHGDVKPQNVLIFKDGDGTFTAKVADFGFSTHFHSEQEDLIQMPKSVPWTAPEHHGRHFTLQSAKAMDVYSFSMLCLWLLFHHQTETTCTPQAKNSSQPISFEETLSKQGDNNLLKWAVQLAADDMNIDAETKDILANFFQSTLHAEPGMRVTDWDRLLGYLAPTRGILEFKTFNESTPPRVENFQLALSIWSFYTADFRLRSYITTQLESIASLSGTKKIHKRLLTANATDQRDLCYRIRFGTQGRKSWNRGSFTFSHHDLVEKEINQIKESSWQITQNSVFRTLQQGGVIYSFLPEYYMEKGLLEEALEISQREVIDIKGVFGEDHDSTTLAREGAIGILHLQGEWKKAEELGVQVMETKKRVLGDEHPSTLGSIGNLASTYRNQGRWKEAEELEVEVMETRKRVLGDEHLDTLTSMANLALTYMNQGRWKEAEELQVKELEIYAIVLGNEHPDTLTSIANLASTYSNQGRWKEAEELQVEVMETSSRVLGDEHPDTLINMANLASTYKNQGRWKEAEELQVEVMETSSRVLGDEHPNTLTSMANLALTYLNQGRWKEAEELEVEVLETSSRVLGDEHPDTLISMANLASTYSNRGRWKEAEELEVEVMETRKRVLGDEHPDTLTSMNNLAFTLKALGHRDSAISTMRTCVGLRTQVLGTHHLDTVSSVDTLNSWCMEIEGITSDI